MCGSVKDLRQRTNCSSCDNYMSCLQLLCCDDLLFHQKKLNTVSLHVCSRLKASYHLGLFVAVTGVLTLVFLSLFASSLSEHDFSTDSIFRQRLDIKMVLLGLLSVIFTLESNI